MKPNKGRGRPSKYVKEKLIGLLYKYSAENPGKIIKLSDLSKKFKIPRHIWEYQISDEIKLFNTHLYEIDEDKIKMLPSINYSVLVKKYINNPEKLEDILSELDFISQAAYKNSMKYDKLKKKYLKLKVKLEAHKEELKEKEDRISFLDRQNKEMIIHSYSELNRKRMGIKENICRLNPRNDTITLRDMEILSNKVVETE